MGKNEKPPRAKFFTRNNNIILLHIFSACLLLGCIFFFFASNMQMFLKDITSWMAFSPILFILGVLFICFYIMTMTYYLSDTKTIWLADRFDLVYKIVFTLLLILLLTRGFLGDFMCVEDWCPYIDDYSGATIDTCCGTRLNVPVPVIIVSIVSGIITWLTPKIRDNNNDEF